MNKPELTDEQRKEREELKKRLLKAIDRNPDEDRNISPLRKINYWR